ncbi:MAG: hypothetical protein FWD48_00735 [Oscillospiraceae bacterium]|nr:hypothetical protein [Oscillospiraceae bacterium]
MQAITNINAYCQIAAYKPSALFVYKSNSRIAIIKGDNGDKKKPDTSALNLHKLYLKKKTTATIVIKYTSTKIIASDVLL